MLNSTKFLLDILRNRIIDSDGTVIPVIKRSYPLDKSPCICLDDSGGATIIQKYRVHRRTEYLVDKIQSYVNIHLYCDTEDDRDYYLTKIRNAIHMVEQDHYKYCTKLGPDNICETVDMQCPAIISTSARGYKNQCPLPEIYEYGNLFTKHNIIRNTFNVEPPFSADDLTKKPPLLHSVLKASMVYEDMTNVGGKISDTMSQRVIIEENNTYGIEEKEE